MSTTFYNQTFGQIIPNSGFIGTMIFFLRMCIKNGGFT